jgi:hypothetical protein
VTARIHLALTALVVALLAAGCGSSGTNQSAASQTSTPAAAWRLPDLQHPGRAHSLVALFNRSAGTPRLILLVSPT